MGEALDILQRYDIATMSDADALHHYLEASALAFADRAAYVGDPAFDSFASDARDDVCVGLADPAGGLVLVTRVEHFHLGIKKHLHRASQPVLPVTPLVPRTSGDLLLCVLFDNCLFS